MASRRIARYIRCNQLIPTFKGMLDDGTITLIACVEVPYLSKGEQGLVISVMERTASS